MYYKDAEGLTNFVSDGASTRIPSSEEIQRYTFKDSEECKMTSDELNSFHRNWKEYVVEWDSNCGRPHSAGEISKYLLDGKLKIELTRKKKVLYFAGQEYLLSSNALEKLENMDVWGSSNDCKKIDETKGKIIFKILYPDGTCLGYRPSDTVMTHLIRLDNNLYRKETGFCLENVFDLVKEVTS